MISNLIIFAIGAKGWGSDGHKSVAAIAESLLSIPAREGIKSLLPSWESMTSIATWADEVGHTPEYSWSKCMHFLDTDGCSLSGDVDCGCCVITAIANYTSRAGDTSLSNSERYEALKFLVHFVGDASQPLHAGHKDDRGGNMVHVTVGWSGHTSTQTNLHSVWDSSMLEHMLHMKSWTFHSLATDLVKKIRSGQFPVDAWERDCDGGVGDQCSIDASGESAELACEFAYTNEKGETILSGSVLTTKYFETRISVVETRIAAAGVRLAAILNGVFSKLQVMNFPEVQVI